MSAVATQGGHKETTGQKYNGPLLHNYTVSQKTSHLWLAITLPHMNKFLIIFLAKCYR